MRNTNIVKQTGYPFQVLLIHGKILTNCSVQVPLNKRDTRQPLKISLEYKLREWEECHKTYQGATPQAQGIAIICPICDETWQNNFYVGEVGEPVPSDSCFSIIKCTVSRRKRYILCQSGIGMPMSSIRNLVTCSKKVTLQGMLI